MKHLRLYLIYIATLLTACDQLPDFRSQAGMAYHFDAPATDWEECLPLGNGRIGLTLDGGIDRETIILNESSMWSGSQQDANNPDAQRALGRIRELIFEGHPDEAQTLMNEAFVCRGMGANGGDAADKAFGSYQLLGALLLDYTYPGDEHTTTSDYHRTLNIEDAVATVTYRHGKGTYTREAFTSFAADVAVVRLTADGERTLQLRVGLSRPERYSVSVDGRELEMHGRLYAGDGQVGPQARTPGDTAIHPEDSLTHAARMEGGGVRYAARVRVMLPQGGSVKSASDTSLAVEGAPEVILLVGMATDYFGHDPAATLRTQLDAANRPYAALRREHVAAYRERYGRVTLRLGRSTSRDAWPIDKRLEAFARDRRDPSLMALYYQFGRYLLLSSTRPGSLPPSAEGLWCHTIHTPDNGCYRTDGPLQMCYWPAETGNLPELIAPLETWTQRLATNGRTTAAAFYGARGWTTHALGNAWGYTAPGRTSLWTAASTSAARLCAPLFEHFRFTRDTAYLRRVYPTLREAALFLADRLTEDPRSHHLVIAPSFSPGNAYLMPDGRRATLCAGATVDDALVRELFTHTLQAAAILHTDAELSTLLTACLARLRPTTLTSDGRIAEWPDPARDADPRAPYAPHLYALFPGTDISPRRTPELAEAAHRTLEARGDAVSGLAGVWRVNYHARLCDGDRAYRILCDLLRPAASADGRPTGRTGTFHNLLFVDPTFRIAGNLGAAAGIAEMLVRSDDDVIEFLPARPAAWSEGEFSGLCVRGGAEASAQWRGRDMQVGLRATRAGTFRIKLPVDAEVLRIKRGGRLASCPVVGGTIAFALTPGETVEITWRQQPALKD
ncbi:glycoside hydrolase [Tannerella sp. oral taxon 808]|nr:glycoside hydrolase [Tannerella sp. oral taxon 808]